MLHHSHADRTRKTLGRDRRRCVMATIASQHFSLLFNINIICRTAAIIPSNPAESQRQGNAAVARAGTRYIYERTCGRYDKIFDKWATAQFERAKLSCRHCQVSTNYSGIRLKNCCNQTLKKSWRGVKHVAHPASYDVLRSFTLHSRRGDFIYYSCMNGHPPAHIGFCLKLIYLKPNLAIVSRDDIGNN